MNSQDWQNRLKEWIASGKLEQVLPEVSALHGVKQPKEFHPEGDVLKHTLLAVDAVNPQSDERVFWAVLLHDVGKATTTELIDGRLRSWGHDKEGARMTPQILKRFDLEYLSDDVAWLVKNHGFMLSWGNNLTTLTKKQKRFCNNLLFPLLIEVATADANATHGKSDKLEKMHKIINLYKQVKPTNSEPTQESLRNA